MNKDQNIVALAPQSITTDTTTVGEIVDLKGAAKHKFAVIFGVVTDGDYDFIIEHGDDAGLSDAADVDAATQIRGNLYNTPVTPLVNEVYEFELLSKFKRFARLKVVSDNTSSGANIAAVASLMKLSGSMPNDKNPVVAVL